MSKKRYKVIFVFIFVITLISLSKPTLGYEETSEKVPISVNMVEFSSHKGEMFDIDSIDIALPQWNLTDLEMKIINIHSLTNEVKMVVNSSNNQEKLSNKVSDNNALAVQLNLTESVILSSIFIYGKAVGSELEPIYLQIEGYDPNTQCPNSTIFGDPIAINISGNDWHEQQFQSPLNLSKGQYFIVLDARSAIGDTANYYWSYDDMPQLYSSYYDNATGWESFGNNSPFSYKLNYYHNITYLPEDVDACIEFESTIYPISNTGMVYLNYLNCKITSDQLNVNFIHNSSYQLIFNLDYDANLSNILQASGILELNHYLPNQWSISPLFSRCGYDYHVLFQIPENWYAIIVYENEIDVSGTFLIEDHLIYISNSSIDITDEWEINASSPNSYCEMQYPEEEWEIGQQVEFFIIAPSISGNITFKLVDNYHYIYYAETKTVIETSTLFSYTITSELSSGLYEAIFLWQNGTDASFQSHSFYLNTNEISNSFPYLQIAILIGIISVFMGSSIYTITKMKNNYSSKSKSESSKYEDLFHLKYIIVSQKRSGLNVYEYFITGNRSNSSLISSYLSVLHELGIEIFETNEEIPVIKIEFEDYFLFMANAGHSKTIFAMTKYPGEEFSKCMIDIARDVEILYGDQIRSFNGCLEEFKGIKKIIESYYPLSMLHPLKLTPLMGSDLTIQEIHMVKKARKLISLQPNQYIDAHSLFSKPIDQDDIALIMKLIQKGIFLPIDDE